MCHPREQYDRIETVESTTEEEHEPRDERESIFARTKATLTSVFVVPGEGGRREPDPTVRMGETTDRGMTNERDDEGTDEEPIPADD